MRPASSERNVSVLTQTIEGFFDTLGIGSFATTTTTTITSFGTSCRARGCPAR
jgi:hypothetical protein